MYWDKKIFSNQSFTRIPNSKIDRIRFGLEHRVAQRRFQHSRLISIKPLEEVFPGISSTRAVIQAAVPTGASLGNVSLHELVILSTVCAYLKPDLLFEFGTYDGLTTLHFAMNSGQDARVITTDLDPDDPARQIITDDTFYTRNVTVGAHFHQKKEESKIEQIYVNSTQFDHRPLRKKVGLIFIDGGHTDEIVRSDTRKALEMVIPGGVIFWHDYVYTQVGVYTWLNELSSSVALMSVPDTTLVYYVSPKQSS